MEYEDLLLEKSNGIATVILNAPDKMNALTKKMGRSLCLVRDELACDDEVKIVIVTGAGRSFCSGGDIEDMKSRFDGTLYDTRYERLQLNAYWTDVFVRLDKPVIAAINGAAVGGGFGIALSCDIRIASETARFGSVFVLRGLVPDCGLSYFLPRVVGTAKALELMFTGEIFDATEAKRLGIVSRVVPRDKLMSEARDLAARIAQQPPIALELTKRVVYRSLINDIAHHIDWEAQCQQLCYETEDHKESAFAFLEKRPTPPFKGK